MPSYKLIYFDLRARAEPARMMFELAGVEYEDFRIPYGGEEWKKLKPTIGLGQIPVLEVDGKELPQTDAILRFVAREHGFEPSSSWDKAMVDVVNGILEDIGLGMLKVFEENDAEKKAEVGKHFAFEYCQPHLNNLEKVLKQTNGGTGWFVGDKITFADVHAFGMLHDGIPPMIGAEPGDLSYMKGQTLLKAFVDRFKAEPKIADWLKRRPKTSF